MTIAVPSTCYQIICDAMVDAGKLGQGREPTGEQLAENMRRLNKYVNYLQTQGAILWVQEDFEISAPILQAGKALYKLGPTGDVVIVNKPRRIIEGYFVDANDSQRPLNQISRNDWDTLSNRDQAGGVGTFIPASQQGTVTSFYVDKQLTSLNVHFWMTPDALTTTGAIRLIVDLQIPNFSQLTDSMFFPVEWALTLEWGLADQISTGMPQEIVDRCAAKSIQYEAALLNWDVEDTSTTFQPDPRGGYVAKRVGRY